MDKLEIDLALKTLMGSESYRVLERLHRASLDHVEMDNPLIGVVIDVETTGLDVEIDELIELAMIKFQYSRDGRIGRVIGEFRSLNAPSVPIPETITALTGIAAADVKGQKISRKEVEAFVSDVALVIAHNAAFDRPFCEAVTPAFEDLNWACSATEIPWRSEGISGSRLEYIVYSYGKFYDAHRAIDDCNALLHVLTFQLPRSKELALSALLARARRAEIRIFAEGAPYEMRGWLKRMGYRWNDGQNRYPRAWWRDVQPEAVDSEIRSLLAEGGSTPINPSQFRMTAKTRFRRDV